MKNLVLVHVFKFVMLMARPLRTGICCGEESVLMEG